MASIRTRLFSKLMSLWLKRRLAEYEESELVKFIRQRTAPLRLLSLPFAKGIKLQPVNEYFESGHVKGEWIHHETGNHRTIYFLHGGGYVAGSPATHRSFTIALSRAAKADVFALDYRLAPEHRFPAAIDDAVNGYRWLLKQKGISHKNIIIGGDSAGGGLAIATLIALRDEGLPLPKAAVCLSPWTDLAGTGTSLTTNDGSDPMFHGDGVKKLASVYCHSEMQLNPLVSPIYADLKGLPPLLIYVSDIEILLDDSVRLAERARHCGAKADLRIRSGLPHVWPIFIGLKLPEACESLAEIASFIQLQFSTADPE